MDAPNPSTPSIELVRSIQEFLSENPSTRSTEEVIQSLRDDGVEFEKILKDIGKQVDRAQNRLRLQAVVSDVKEAARRPVKRAVAGISELKRLVEDRIAGLGADAALTAFYRKLETAEEEDLLSLLDDFDELESKIDERGHAEGQ